MQAFTTISSFLSTIFLFNLQILVVLWLFKTGQLILWLLVAVSETN